jgi:hypothetical protein
MFSLTRRSRLAQSASFIAAIAALTPICGMAFAETSGHNRCAAYGSNYVAVSGGEGCVRLGGHIRADNPRPDGVAHATAEAPALLGAPAGFARALADGVSGVSQSFQGRPTPSAQLYRR